MFKFARASWGPYLLLVLLVVALYGRFLRNPLIFDDMNYFLDLGDGGQAIDFIKFSLLDLRSLPYASLGWTKAVFGLELPPFRIGNLLLHAACVTVLYSLVKQLIAATYQPVRPDAPHAGHIALVSALLFAVHPVSTYATGYLIQRSILMAMLFGLLALWAYTRGSLEKRPVWLWSSVLFYYLAVFSKEQAVTLIAVFPVLTVLLHQDWRSQLMSRKGPFFVMILIAALAVFARRGVFGTLYEVDSRAMLGDEYGPWTYPLSILTQCGLFFKYLGLWILPNPAWMSIDMHEPFARSFWSIRTLWIPAFAAWGLVGVFLLRKRSRAGLLGFAMLVPWLMFMTELTTVRVQDSFVLYRSYLWFPLFLPLIPLVASCISLNAKMLMGLTIGVSAVLFMHSMERLVTLSSPILVWEDARKLLDDNPDAKGVDRIYYNLARHLLLNDMLLDSENVVEKALSVNPQFAQAYAIRGALHNKKREWLPAIENYTKAREINLQRKEPANSTYLVGRAVAYEGAGQLQLSVNDYLEACRIDAKVCEILRKKATPVTSP